MEMTLLLSDCQDLPLQSMRILTKLLFQFVWAGIQPYQSLKLPIWLLAGVVQPMIELIKETLLGKDNKQDRPCSTEQGIKQFQDRLLCRNKNLISFFKNTTY